MPSIESSFFMNFLPVQAIYTHNPNELSNLTFVFLECVLCVVLSSSLYSLLGI